MREVSRLNVIDDIESGKLIVAELVNGNLTKLVPDFNANTELLRLAKLGASRQWVSVAERLPN